MIDRPAVPRLVPETPLPPYSYVPGGGMPHPISDPNGHSAGHRLATNRRFHPDRWRDEPLYLLGFDLLNRQFFWEAHESWEPLWLAAGRKGPVADLLKGLIALAAAGVKHREGRPRGVATHSRRAARLFRSVTDEVGGPNPILLGLRLLPPTALAEGIARSGWPEQPILVLPEPPIGGPVTPSVVNPRPGVGP